MEPIGVWSPSSYLNAALGTEFQDPENQLNLCPGKQFKGAEKKTHWASACPTPLSPGQWSLCMLPGSSFHKMVRASRHMVSSVCIHNVAIVATRKIAGILFIPSTLLIISNKGDRMMAETECWTHFEDSWAPGLASPLSIFLSLCAFLFTIYKSRRLDVDF